MTSVSPFRWPSHESLLRGKAMVRAGLPQVIRSRLGVVAEALFALPQGVFRLLAFGDVAQIPHHGPYRGLVQPIGDDGFQPTPRSILVPHAALRGKEFPRLLQQAGPIRPGGIMLVRVDESHAML